MRLSIIAGLICSGLAALAVACGGGDDKATNTIGPGDITATAAASGSDTGNATSTKTSKAPATSAGGASDGHLAEYFRDLAARFQHSRNDSDEATADYNRAIEAATTLDEQKQAINAFLDAMIVVFDDSILTMNGFSVPPEANGPHSAFRDDIVQAKAISETLLNDLDTADTAEAVDAITNDFNDRVATLVNHAQAACRDLQEIANAHAISENLECKAA